MSLIKGENVIIYVYDGGMWKPIVCGRSCTLTTNADTIETSITGTGAWRTYEYSALTWSATMDGAVMLGMNNTLGLADVRAYQYSRLKMIIRYQRTDDSGNVYLEEGIGIIKTISDVGDYQDVATFSIEFQGSGPLTISFTPTPIDPTAKVKRIEYTATGGETYFESASLIVKDILDVVVDGIGRSGIITSGSPVDQEALYTSGTGRITLPIPMDAGMNLYVLYQDI